jgi:dihydroorotate dehydrogenase electron transfer subunit
MKPQPDSLITDTSTRMSPRWGATDGTVIRNERLSGKELHYAVIEIPELADPPAAGQFFMVAAGEEPPPTLLRRPMSVARCWRESGKYRLGFLYSAVGVGTRALAASQRSWKMLGPLGRGYPLGSDAPAILVAGGRGVAPLIFLAEELAQRGRSAVLLNGARTADELCSPAEMGAPPLAPGSIELESTEDGTRGIHGRVLEMLADERVAALAAEPGAVFYSCGPHGLLAAVGAEARRRGRTAWVAAEAHMSCGTGICRSCVLPRTTGSPVPGDASNPRYILACLEGPVVEAATVDWESAP